MKSESLQIEEGNYMRILNRIIDALACMKLSGREFRVILAVLRFTYGYNRKDYNFTIPGIAKHTAIHYSDINKIIARLVAKNILIVERTGRLIQIGFNKYYRNWSPIKQLAIETEQPGDNATVETGQKHLKKPGAVRQKHRKNSGDTPKKLGKNTETKRGKGKPAKPKRKVKYIHIKTNTHTTEPPDKILAIKLLWNEKVLQQREKKIRGFIGLRDPKKPDKKLDSVLNKRIIEHGLQACLQAVENYHRFMCLPKEHKRWQGHAWSCYEFFKRDKDNVVRFGDWDTVVFNFCDAAKIPPPMVLDMTVSKAISILKTDHTSSTMQDILNRMPDEQYIEFKCWLQTAGDKVLIHQHNEALKRGARRKNDT